MMKHSILVAATVAATLGLAACQKETVVQPVPVPTPAPSPAVVTVPTPVPVPGPQGPAGAPGAEGAPGAPGKSGGTVVVVPVPVEEQKK